MKYFTFLTAVFCLSLVSAVANNGDKFRIADAGSVADAVDQIRLTLERQGFEIVATIDHSAAAASVDLDLRPTTVIFASHPLLEKALIRRSQTAALDLPVKFLVFEGEDGQIHLKFNDEGFLIDRHGIRQRDRLLRLLDSVLNQFGPLGNGIVTIRSDKSVDETVEALFAVLEERGFRIPIPGGIDFTEWGRIRGKKVRPTKLIVFGNPVVGTPLMQNDQSIGLDLPQKFLVFEDHEGQVSIAFNAPVFLAEKHNLQRDADPGPITLEMRLQNITNALKSLAEAASTSDR